MASESTKRKCLGADCENDASSLQCPSCLKLGVKDSFFCSQDCFKKNWVSHGRMLRNTEIWQRLTDFCLRRASIKHFTSLRVTFSVPCSLRK